MTLYNEVINYNAFINYNGSGSTPPIVATTGAGDDNWKKYLEWLKKRKKKEFKRRAPSLGLLEKDANKIVEMAAKQVEAQEEQYYADFINEAKNTVEDTVFQIYDNFWKQIAVDKKQISELIALQLAQEQDEEEFLMMI